MKNSCITIIITTLAMSFSLIHSSESDGLLAIGATSTSSPHSCIEALVNDHAKRNLKTEYRILEENNRLELLRLLAVLGHNYPYKQLPLKLTSPSVSSYSAAAIRDCLAGAFDAQQGTTPLLDVLLSGMPQDIILELLANQHFNKPETINWIIKIILRNRNLPGYNTPALLAPFIALATGKIIKDHDQRPLRLAAESTATCASCACGAACAVGCCIVSHGQSGPFSSVIASALSACTSGAATIACCSAKLLAAEKATKQNEDKFQRLQSLLRQLNPPQQPEAAEMH